MRSSPRWLIFLIDLLLTGMAFVFTYWVRFNFELGFPARKLFIQFPWVLLVASVGFAIWKPYRGVVRHTGWQDIRLIIRSNLTIAILMLLSTWWARFVHPFEPLNFPYSVIFIFFVLNSLFMTGARAIYKSFYYKISQQGAGVVKVMLYGTDLKSIRTMEILRSGNNHRYIFEGFVIPREDTVSRGVKRIQGIPIYRQDQLSPDFLQRKKIDQLIVTSEITNPISILKELDKFVQAGVDIKIVPPADKWIEGSFDANQLQSLDMEMLLPRQPIRVDDDGLKNMFAGKTVWVTGGAGSIGSMLSRLIIRYGPARLVVLDQAETPLYELKVDLQSRGFKNFLTVLADLTDREVINNIFRKHRPHYIFHAAAYKHVPVLEEDPYYGVAVNVMATKFLMEKALEYGVEKFVQISTDKAVNPTNIMGATKRIAELTARCMQEESSRTQFIVTRFGNVLGSNGSVIHLFKKQIQNGGPVTVTHPEITRYFMTIPEAAHLVLKAAETGSGGKIFVFDMGEPVRIYDLAVKMIKLAGKKFPDDIDIQIVGLRPGEKIYEELLTREESVEKTDLEKLYISKLVPLDCRRFRQQIEHLKQADWSHRQQLIAILKEMVPEYQPDLRES